MPHALTLHIPQPCPKSWAAMTPTTGTGRHCAACAKTVVDFTLKSDAEILAYLAKAASGHTCGRFAAGQLERPLQLAATVAPTGWWPAWLAAVVAVWGLREGMSVAAKAQAPSEWRAHYWGGPVPAAPQVPEAPQLDMPLAKARITLASPAASDTIGTSLVIRGVVLDSAERMGLPGVTVLLKNTQIGVLTDEHGAFELVVPAQYITAGHAEIQLNYVGYMTEQHMVAVGASAPVNRFYLEADVKGMLTGEVIICRLPPRKFPPAPWHPRAFYYWGKYWLTRPFRNG